MRATSFFTSASLLRTIAYPATPKRSGGSSGCFARRPRIALVVFDPRPSVLVALLLPPRAHDVKREPTIRDLVDRRSFLRDKRRETEVRANCGHELESLGERRERRGGSPGLQAIRLGS